MKREEIRSAEQMVKLFQEDPALIAKLQQDPLKVLQETAPRAVEKADQTIYKRDKLIYRIAIGVLGSLALVAAIGSIVLVLDEKETPEVLVALGSAAVGALVGLFATPPQ